MSGETLTIYGPGLPILVVLAILSVISITVIVARWVSLGPAVKGSERRENAFRLLADGNSDGAIQNLSPAKNDADRIACFGMERLQSGLAGLEEALAVEGNAAAKGFFRHVRLIETIAMVSPLLGLLGTVLGMIQAFRDLEMSGGAANASLLAGGIWQALLTTAAGLIVALPAAAGAALLTARAEAATGEIETVIGRLLAVVASRDGAS